MKIIIMKFKMIQNDNNNNNNNKNNDDTRIIHYLE